MSGGSFDYLYSRAPEAVSTLAAELSTMADYAARASAPAAHARLLRLAALASELAEALVRDADVLHAVEWRASGDYGDDGVQRVEVKPWPNGEPATALAVQQALAQLRAAVAEAQATLRALSSEPP